MPTKPLTQITLFTMGRENLEKRILKTYTESSDADSVIQYVVAVLIRHCLCISDFSGMCNELIRDLFLTAEPTDVLRKFCPLFQNIFETGNEWDQVLRRVYKNTKEYHRYNNRLSESKKYLFGKTTPAEALSGQQFKLISTFEDAIGKTHTWSLRDADPYSSAMKIDAVLELLSSLTIFEKDDVRRFVKLENSEIHNCTRYAKIKKGEIVEETAEVQVTPLETRVYLEQLSPDEKLELIKQLLPEGVFLSEKSKEMVQQEEGFVTIKKNEQAEESASHEAKESEIEVSATSKPAPTEPSMVLSATKPPAINFKKPKSGKQKERERKDELMKKTKKGKDRSRKKRKR